MKKASIDMIEVRNLTAGYKVNKENIEVLKKISFTVSAGELVCLMGPNGAGKSTLLRCLSGLQSFSDGEILIERQLLSSLSSNVLAKKLAVVLTEQIVASHMTVRELIAMGRYPHLSWLLKYEPNDQMIIDKMAEDCGVADFLDKNIHSLSDGQRQKVLIARALAQESSILILDEPTSHLDLNNRVEIINLLKEISRKEKKAVIMATHELDLALQMADRLLLLNSNGELFQGIPEDLVVNGKLDEVFAFKGYDLKTGKVEHLQSGKTIGLRGRGYMLLWTKNALEREGFEISEKAESFISVYEENGKLCWKVNDQIFASIESLLQSIR